MCNAQAAQIIAAKPQVDVEMLREILSDIVSDDKHAGQIIQHLRSLLMRGEMQFQAVEIGDLLSTVLTLANSTLTERNVRLEAHIDGSIPAVSGDRVELQQVLLNLILNACESMSNNAASDRRIQVIAALDDDRRTVRTSVLDCGSGIDAEQLERVFDPFFTTKKRGLGLGLGGLPVHRRGAQGKAVGHEQFRSRSGISFYIAGIERETNEKGERMMDIAARTVFVVDDTREVRVALSRVLSAAGYQVRSFESAEQFLEEQDGETPGCLLLDICMPGMSGLDVQRSLAHSIDSRPIVFLTGHGDVQTSVQAMKVGAVDFLTKPIDDARLFAAVDQALELDFAARNQRAIRREIEKRLADLTPRERQVMDQVIRGRLNKQIAADLGIGEKTVKVHRARVMAKMDVRSVAELVQLASRVESGPGGDPSSRLK